MNMAHGLRIVTWSEHSINHIPIWTPPGLSKAFNAYMFDVPGYANEDTFLIIPAIYVCQGSEEVLKDFVRVIRFCVERYNSSRGY